LRLFSFGGYGLALAALALVVFGAYDSYPVSSICRQEINDIDAGNNEVRLGGLRSAWPRQTQVEGKAYLSNPPGVYSPRRRRYSSARDL